MIDSVNRQKFAEDGFLVIEAVVPETLCSAVRQSICDFLNIREFEPDDWRESSVPAHGIVPIHHPQSLWNIRQLPSVHRVFAELHGTGALWVSIDRASFKPPGSTFGKRLPADPIHWDGDPGIHGKLSTQGLVYLTDTDPEQGGFCCVPDLYRHLDDWLPEHENEARRRKPDTDDYEIVKVGAPAGSLLVWNRLLPHSSACNESDLPRWAQYVAMDPAGDSSARETLARLYREKRPPDWAVSQRIANQQIPETGKPAKLTELGERLTGVRSW